MKNQKCIFCGSYFTIENQKTNEHVIPRWLLKWLGIQDIIINPSHIRPTGEIVNSRSHSVENLVEGRVCITCNNGWMSRLELDTQPFLLDLMTGDRQVIDLVESERFILARWMCKTSYVLNSSSNFPFKIPNIHYKELFKTTNSLPSNIFVYAQQHHGERTFFWIQQPTWIIHDELGRANEINTSETYKLTFQFKKLIITLSYVCIDRVVPVIWKGIHVPMYPLNGPIGFYSRDDFPWDSSEEATVFFHLGVHLLRK
jgi:hypothetical protein